MARTALKRSRRTIETTSKGATSSDGSKSQTKLPVEQKEPKKRKRDHSSGLSKIPELYTEAGEIYVCGQGDFGQLGLGNLLDTDDDDADAEITNPKRSSVKAERASRVKQVTAGGMHSVALTDEGTVFTTGVNDEGALGRKTDTEVWNSSGLPGAAGDAHSWGEVDIPQTHGSIAQISAGDSHTAALTDYGAVWAWGCYRGSSGPFGFSPKEKFALRPTMVYSPDSQREQVISISSGADHVLALRRDGSVISWGYGEQGQLGRLGTRTNAPERAMLQPAIVPLHKIKGHSSKPKFKAVAVEAASFGSFIVSASGEAVAFGVNASGQLGFNVAGGTVDENVIHRPTLVSSLEAHGAVRSIAAGKAHSLALTQQGLVLSFGLQTYGRLGQKSANANSDAALLPGQVDGLAQVEATKIVAGHDTSAVVDAEGSAYLWGMGSTYQLANGKDSDVLLPAKMNVDKVEGGARKILQISFGGQHTLILAQPAK